MSAESRDLYERFVLWVLTRPDGPEDFLSFVREEVIPWYGVRYGKCADCHRDHRVDRARLPW